MTLIEDLWFDWDIIMSGSKSGHVMMTLWIGKARLEIEISWVMEHDKN